MIYYIPITFQFSRESIATHSLGNCSSFAGVLAEHKYQHTERNRRKKARFRSVLRFEVMLVCLMDKLIQVMPVLALGSNLRQVNADDVQA